MACPSLSPWASVRLPWPRLQPPPRQTERADFPHSAFLMTSRQGLWGLSASSAFETGSQSLLHLVWSRSAFARAKILSLRSCRSWAALSSRPGLSLSVEECHQQGRFAPRTLLRFGATTSPSATLSSSTDFPGSPVLRPPWLRRFRGGTRRASPVARRALVTVLSLPPRRRVPPRQPHCGSSCCLRPPVGGSASGSSHFRGHLCVHSRYGPVTRRPSRR